MVEERSRLSSYAICTALAIPLVLLGYFFVGYLGVVGIALATAVTAACVAGSRAVQRRAELTNTPSRSAWPSD